MHGYVVTMYVRKTTRTYKGKTYTNHLLVESVHTPKGPRQKVVCSLGDLKPRPKEAWLALVRTVEAKLSGQEQLFDEPAPEAETIVRRIKEKKAANRKRGEEDRHRNRANDLVAVHTDEVTTERHREAGSVYVGYQFWKRLGLDDILTDVGLTARARALTCVMTINRLVHPSSELAMPDWIRSTALDDLMGVDFTWLAEDSLYRNLDRLHPRRTAIESALFEREQTLFNLDRTVFLYDLTSTYFEGRAERNPKARRGYSRDKRPDCKQVVVGLVVNPDGFPIAHEVFEGNAQDRKTLGKMLDLIDQRVGLKPNQTVVVDRGMAYDNNLEEITDRKLHYIVASRQSERDVWLADFEDAEGFEPVIRQPSPRNPCQKKSHIQVKMRRRDNQTLVLCLSSERKEKDCAIREKQEGRFLADVAKLQKRVRRGGLVKPVKVGEAMGRLKERYPRVARYYALDYDPEKKRLTCNLDRARRSKAEKLDGSYILKSDRNDLSADETWRFYMLLTRAENAFRSMKSPLLVRPIHHQREERTETHVFLSVLAYHLLVAIEKTLLDQEVHTSWATVRATLRTHQVCTVVLPADGGSVLRIRRASTPEPQHVELYERLGVPTKIMSPRKTWSDGEAPYSDAKNR
jgi:transposase